MMLIQVFSCPPFGTNAYVVSCKETSQAMVIDPGANSFDKITAFAKKQSLDLTAVLLTHSHWDHIAEVSLFHTKLNLPVYIHALDAGNLAAPGSDGLAAPFPIEGCLPSSYLEDGQCLNIGNLILKVIHTPGHSPGGVCFYIEAEQVLFSGDTLFKGTLGNLSLPTAQPNLMWTSLKRLATLPANTKVYPGHGQPTTIGQEHWMANAEQLFT